MERHLSQQEAERRLEEAAKSFDWVTKLLGHARKDLLSGYRSLHAQLKDGDRLEIRVVKKTHECQHIEIDYPCFEVVLISGSEEPRVVSTYSPGFSCASSRPLYDNK